MPSPPDASPGSSLDDQPTEDRQNANSEAPGAAVPTQIWVLDGDGAVALPDAVAREEPLEIRLYDGRTAPRSHGITLRTPGHDEELVRGLLFAEGLLETATDLEAFEPLPPGAGVRRDTVAIARLRSGLAPDPDAPRRAFVASSACGMCGQIDLSALWLQPPQDTTGEDASPHFAPSMLLHLPEPLRRAQGTFRRTGGLHGAALFSPDGEFLVVREDIGRHNALDKVIGWALAEGLVPLRHYGLLVSGRAGYELVHKAVRAGAALLAAVSAPSSLAVATAQRFDLTLVGFLREGRCNVYSGGWRMGIEE